jgi:hypothetical protein
MFGWLNEMNSKLTILLLSLGFSISYPFGVARKVESRVLDLTMIKGQSDNQKQRIIQKTNEYDNGKYQLS